MEMDQLLNAVTAGNAGRVHELLHAHPLLPGESMEDAFRIAVEINHPYIVDMFLADGRVVPSYDVLKIAVFHGYTEIVEALLRDGRVEPHNGLLYRASMRGHTRIVQILLADGRFDPGAYDGLALHMAVEQGFYDIVHLLLHDPRVNTLGTDLLQTAIANGREDVLHVLLTFGRFTRGQRQIALEMAVDSALPRMVDILSERVGPWPPRLYVKDPRVECADAAHGGHGINAWDEEHHCPVCPIGLDCLPQGDDMVVKTSNGYCYDRDNLTRWLNAKHTDPVTRESPDQQWKRQWWIR